MFPEVEFLLHLLEGGMISLVEFILKRDFNWMTLRISLSVA
jgi:hypothetical protein